MSASLQPDRQRRGQRVKLAGTVLALIRLQNTRQIRARMHELSVSGGLLHLDNPLDEGIKVEILFHLGSCTVRNTAVMMFPMWATQGCLQPFEFADLAEEDRGQLETQLQKFLDGLAPGSSAHQANFAAASGSGQ
jgi:hypothetical protein